MMVYTGTSTRYIAIAAPDALKGGGPDENASIIRAILEGQEGAGADIVVLNAAAAIVAGGKAADLRAGVAVAREAIASGRALNTLNRLIELTNA